jgi:CheY-like chemotaxis protein
MSQTNSTEPRSGWLIVEDESLVAMLIEEALTEIGLPTLGPATRVAKAIQLIEAHPPEGAVLDVNLAGEKVYPVADTLAAFGIPFVFLTGYGEAGVRQGYEGRPVLQKPFSIEQVQMAVKRLQQGTGADSALGLVIAPT